MNTRFPGTFGESSNKILQARFSRKRTRWSQSSGNPVIIKITTYNPNNSNNNSNKNLAKIDQHIFDINNVIRKICKDQVLKTIDDRGVDILTEGDIKSVYDTAIISVIHKFITISNECEKIYLQECHQAGKEAGKLR